MECLMTDANCQTVERVNTRLAQLLKNAQRALCGESAFTADDVRALQTLLEEIAPVAEHAVQLRRIHPEINAPLDRYREQLVLLQHTVERLRITLLVQRATLEAGKEQASATKQWCNAFQKTR
jgi:hypothetical protein